MPEHFLTRRPIPNGTSVTDPGSVCVLCQQDLTLVAADRLNRFEAFVRDDSQQRAEIARTAYVRALATFRDDAVSLPELARIVATVRDEPRQDGLAMEIRGAALRATVASSPDQATPRESRRRY